MSPIPKDGRRSADWEALATEARQSNDFVEGPRDQWPSRVYAINSGALAAFRPKGAYVASSRRDPDSTDPRKVIVYVKYVGD